MHGKSKARKQASFAGHGYMSFLACVIDAKRLAHRTMHQAAVPVEPDVAMTDKSDLALSES